MDLNKYSLLFHLPDYWLKGSVLIVGSSVEKGLTNFHR
jgi:hypothetical protein